jgi:hypothetical protein
VLFDEGDDTVIAALRNQDAIVKFTRDGALVWILGPPANWEGFEDFLLTPDGGEFAWPYHAHAPELTGADSILLFDNGNRRASPFTGEPIVPADANQSRAVEYTIDAEAMTISQTWEWGLDEAGEQLYSPFAGDADRLPQTGNTLITFGALCTVGGVPSDDLDACLSRARVIEVDTETGERVFDLRVDDDEPGSQGYVVWRAERLPTLYPGGNPTIELASP